MDRTELAWAAGFWDGEGSSYLAWAEGRQTGQPHARVNQSGSGGVPEVLRRFNMILGFGRIGGPYLLDGREPLYRWEVTSRSEVADTYGALRPYLGRVKRAQFLETLGLREPVPVSEPLHDPKLLIAWSAGLFDGEGSTYPARHRSHAGYFVLEAAVTQSSRDGVPEVLDRFRATFGVGKIYGPYLSGDGHAPVYRWKSHRRDAIAQMIQTMGAQLGAVKRAQATAALKVVDAQAPLPRGNPAWGNRKTHCVKGHEYARARSRPFRGRGVNTEAPRDSSKCLQCLREYARERRTERSRGQRRGSRARRDRPTC